MKRWLQQIRSRKVKAVLLLEPVSLSEQQTVQAIEVFVIIGVANPTSVDIPKQRINLSVIKEGEAVQKFA